MKKWQDMIREIMKMMNRLIIKTKEIPRRKKNLRKK